MKKLPFLASSLEDLREFLKSVKSEVGFNKRLRGLLKEQNL
jgi:hypothetical protein